MILIELLILYFISVKIGKIAREKGLSVAKWRIYAILAWFFFEGIGAQLAMYHLGINPPQNVDEISKILLNNPEISLFGVFCAFGGYLFVRWLLERKPSIKE
jgi:hypothetical protein